MSSPPADRSGGSLTYDLRGLVWGIQSEVAVITSLCGRIDDHVRAVNAVRAEAARRLAVLDALVDSAHDEQLRSWLEELAQAPLPRITETWPDRLYTD